MLKNNYHVRIKWGDCDAAAITFYPNYFRWFDEATWQLFGLAGFTSAGLMQERGVFIPLVEAQSRFHRPGHLGDEIVIESHVAEWRDKVFLVSHTARCGGHLVLEGTELRCWAVRHPDDPRRFRSLPVPADVRAALEGAGA
ncbi:MAG: acyl-CoA thioesterase [Rhodocyclales bacterium]|nr:acyl-CoA thioesterase [Rhodocyclales bacterium]